MSLTILERGAPRLGNAPWAGDSLRSRPFPISLDTKSKCGLILLCAFPSCGGFWNLKSCVSCMCGSPTILGLYFPGIILVPLLAGQTSGVTTGLVCGSCRKAVPSVLKEPGHRGCFVRHKPNILLIFHLGIGSSGSVVKHRLYPTGPSAG